MTRGRTVGVLCMLAVVVWAPGLATAQTSRYHMSVTLDGIETTIAVRGTVELTDDGREIRSLGPDGELTIAQGSWLRRVFIGGVARLVMRTAADGTLIREFYVGGRSTPYEPDGAAWLAARLPRLLTTGFAARSRVEQLLRTSDAAGVLAVIPELRSDYVQALYLRTLIERADLRGTGLVPALSVAGHEIDSDYELGQILRDTIDRTAGDAAATQTLLEAALTIQSDYEMGRILREMAETPAVEHARTAFFAAVGTISSDYEHRRVLSAVAGMPILSADTTAALLASAGGIQSDYELATFLVGLAQRHPLDDTERAAFVATAGGVASSYERNRALAALVGQPAQAPIARDR